MIASLARGAVVSGGMIMVLPMVLGADSIWYVMLITEVVVATYSVLYMIQYTKKLNG